MSQNENEGNRSHRAEIQLFAALISATAMIIAAIISQDLFAEKISNALDRTLLAKKVHINAVAASSGSTIYYANNDLLTFLETPQMVGPGDTNQDQLSKAFVTFWLGEVPKTATILKATVHIYCGVSGHPESLPGLRFQQVDFGTYEQADFYMPGGFMWTWQNGGPVVEQCSGSEGELRLQSDAFTAIVQQHLNSEWLQFVFYFDGNLIIPNQISDGITLRRLPSLEIKYQLPDS